MPPLLCLLTNKTTHDKLRLGDIWSPIEKSRKLNFDMSANPGIFDCTTTKIGNALSFAQGR